MLTLAANLAGKGKARNLKLRDADWMQAIRSRCGGGLGEAWSVEMHAQMIPCMGVQDGRTGRTHCDERWLTHLDHISRWTLQPEPSVV